MIPLSETAQSAPNPNQSSTTQSALITSAVAQQKVVAPQNGAGAGGSDNNTARDPRSIPLKAQKVVERADPRPEQPARNDDALTRSAVEAQETASTEEKIKSAFLARREIGELLSVIRDPEDQLLPEDPEDLKG